MSKSDADQPKLPRPIRPLEPTAIYWDGDVPYPMYSPKLSKAQVNDLIGVGFSSLYAPLRTNGQCERKECGEPRETCDTHGDYLPGEQKWEGMSCMEVAAVRLGQKAASGDIEALEKGLDRIVGKPKQISENLNVNMTLERFLDDLPDPADMPDYVPPYDVEDLMHMKADAAEAGIVDAEEVEPKQRKTVDFI
jgi:hypothetical protein